MSKVLRGVPGKEMLLLIENYIPFGYKNRISRETLQTITRQSDRKNRKEMEDALYERNVAIVNIDNGYFRPDGSLGDAEKARSYLYRERTRSKSCSKHCKALEAALNPSVPRECNDLIDKQISLAELGLI